MKQRNSSERGQVLVLLAIGFVVFLGFVALALDGGMAYSNRRHAQNAADSGSLAGGGAAALSLENSHLDYSSWNCADARATAAMTAASGAAILRANDNGYVIGVETGDGNEVITECSNGDDNGSFVDKYIDITTDISATTQTNFAHLFFGGYLRNRVEAVTRVRPRSPLAFGFAIVSTADSCPNQNQGGISFDGGGSGQNLSLSGGGIFSNSCIRANGGIDVSVDAPYPIRYVDDYTQNGSGSVSPAPQPGPVEMPDFTIPAPDCSSVPVRSDPGNSGDVTLQPGRYGQIRHNNGTVTLEPGLYCISNGFEVNGDVIQGNGVTLYIQGGDFSVGAQAQVDLAAPAPSCAAPDCPPAVAGLLIYLPESNDGEVSMRGNVSSLYTGLVYVPSGTIDVGGGSSEMPTVNTQLIGWTVKIHGNVSIDINFNGGQTYNRPAALELYR